MNNREKIERLFAQFTARYGEMELRAGQSLEAVKASWIRSVGRYDAEAIKAGMVTIFANTRFTRWPEEGVFLGILREMGCTPEHAPEADTRPHAVKQAEADASRWYANVVISRAPDNVFPFTIEEAILHIIGAGRPENYRKPFGRLLTDAWLHGDIPRDFDAKAKAYFAEMQSRRVKYLDAVNQHGRVAVHERRVGL